MITDRVRVAFSVAVFITLPPTVPGHAAKMSGVQLPRSGAAISNVRACYSYDDLALRLVADLTDDEVPDDL